MRTFLVVILFLNTFLYSQDTIKLYYGINKHKITQEHKKLLNQLIETENISELSIIGYTDYLGSKEYNLWLSKKRADQVWNYLESKKKFFLEVKGSGETGKVLESNEGIKENRRVEIIYRNRAPSRLLYSEKDISDTLNINVEELKVGDKLVLKNFNFLGGRHFLISESEPELRRLVDVMVKHPKLKIELHGHICCDTDHDDGWDVDDQNYNLSENRAKFIYDHLVSKGVSKDRMTYKGFGRSNPIYALELDEAQKTANRRVEILIVDK